MDQFWLTDEQPAKSVALLPDMLGQRIGPRIAQSAWRINMQSV